MDQTKAHPDHEQHETVNKPCRSCTDFKSWTKSMFSGKKHTKEDTKKQTDKEQPKTTSETIQTKHALKNNDYEEECPAGKSELGNHTWTFLHTMAAQYPEKPNPIQQKDMSSLIDIFSRVFPCEYCAQDLREDLKKFKPDVSSNQNFSQYLCHLHNRINAKIGKPEFDCSYVNYRWKDGWPDGKCD